MDDVPEPTCCPPSWPRWTSRSRRRSARCSPTRDRARRHRLRARPGRLARGVRRLRRDALRLAGRPRPGAARRRRDDRGRRAAARPHRAGRRRRRQPARLPALLRRHRARSGGASSRRRSRRGERRTSSTSTRSSRPSPRGARAYLLCHPHNPTGRSFAREELEAVAALAARYGVTVDLRRGPRAADAAGRDAPPLPLARRRGGRARASRSAGASKAWNIAGLKCALIVTASERMEARLASARSRRRCATTSAISACSPRSPRSSRAAPGSTRSSPTSTATAGALAGAARRRLPEVGLRPAPGGVPGLARLPRARARRRPGRGVPRARPGRAQLRAGVRGAGRGFARLNFGTSSALLEEAVARMARRRRRAEAQRGSRADGARRSRARARRRRAG